jgi:ribokinase
MENQGRERHFSTNLPDFDIWLGALADIRLVQRGYATGSCQFCHGCFDKYYHSDEADVHRQNLSIKVLKMRLFVLGSFVQACCWKVDRLPLPGETLTATALSIEAGGKGLNVAIGSRRLAPQAQVDVILGVGQDAAADELLKRLAVEGVGSEHFYRLAAQSGYGSGHISADGQNAIAVLPGPNLLLTAEHANLARPAIEAADLVYGQFETSLAVLTRAFSIAKSTQKNHPPLTVLNPSPWQPIPLELLDCVDVLVVNEVEAAKLLQLTNPLSGLDQATAINIIKSVLDSFWTYFKGEWLIVTLGDQGSLAWQRHAPQGWPVSAPAFDIQAVDTVGAGDAFASALCVALARKDIPIALALKEANACGALVAKELGVLDALPKRSKLDEYLSNNSY